MRENARPTAKGPWTCTRCGRRFAKRRQAHSCKVRSIDDHFREKDPELRSIFDSLLRGLERRGPLRVDAVESSINLASNHHFGAVAVRREYLRVGFLLNREIRDARISGVERVGPHRVGHHVIIRSLSDLDPQLLDWLAEAQAMQAGAVSQRRRQPPERGRT